MDERQEDTIVAQHTELVLIIIDEGTIINGNNKLILSYIFAQLQNLTIHCALDFKIVHDILLLLASDRDQELLITIIKHSH